MEGYGSPYHRRQSFQERRRKVDWVVRMATILSLVAWIVAFTVWIVLYVAEPDKRFAFTETAVITNTTDFRTEDIAEARRDYWDEALLPIAFGLLVASLIICVVAFVFNAMRMRRKTDKYRKSIMVIGGVTIIGIVLFLIFFGSDFLWGG